MNQGNQHIINNKNFNETYVVEEEIRISIAQEPFLLTEADYLRIGKTFQDFDNLVPLCVSISLGALITLIAKAIQVLIEGSIFYIESYEWIIPLAGFGVSLLLKLISCLHPSEKKVVMNKIEKHFDETQVSRKIERK